MKTSGALRFLCLVVISSLLSDFYSLMSLPHSIENATERQILKDVQVQRSATTAHVQGTDFLKRAGMVQMISGTVSKHCEYLSFQRFADDEEACFRFGTDASIIWFLSSLCSLHVTHRFILNPRFNISFVGGASSSFLKIPSSLFLCLTALPSKNYCL